MNPDQLSKLSQEYVLVRKTKTPLYVEEKTDDGRYEGGDSDVRRRGTLHQDDEDGTPPSGTLEIPRMLMHRSLQGMKKATKPIQAYLSFYERSSGGANTDFSWSSALQPNLDTSWASWQSVFDEVKVLSAELIWQCWFSTLPTGFATQTPNAIAVYETSTAPALASVNAGLQYEHFSLMNIGSNSNGTYATAPQNTAKGGHMILKAKVPKGEALSNVSTIVSAGLWRPTTDASNYQWGYFQGYVAQGGATSVIQCERFVRMRCEFRCRR